MDQITELQQFQKLDDGTHPTTEFEHLKTEVYVNSKKSMINILGIIFATGTIILVSFLATNGHTFIKSCGQTMLVFVIMMLVHMSLCVLMFALGFRRVKTDGSDLSSCKNWILTYGSGFLIVVGFIVFLYGIIFADETGTCDTTPMYYVTLLYFLTFQGSFALAFSFFIQVRHYLSKQPILPSHIAI
jgi:cytochrome c biogenesis factor